MSNQNISNYVILAEAAYANFSNYKLEDKEELGQAIIDTGKEDDEPNEKSTTIKLADYITSRYDVIAHHHDQAGDGFFTSDILNGSGFSATLFQDKVSKAYVLALKGSKGAQDLIGADLNDIVLDGLAHHQIVEMYNFWQSLTQTEYHPATIKTDWALTAEYAAKRLEASTRRESYSLEQFLAEKGLAGQGYFNDSNVLKAVPNHPFGNVIRQVVIDTSEANKQSGKGLDIQVTTTGHSLGGHLSMVFSRLFPQATLHTYMVNGAGEGGKNNPVASDNQTNIRELFAALGGAEAYEKNKITSLRGNKNINFTAMDSNDSLYFPEQWQAWGLVQPGVKQDLFIESGIEHALGHGTTQMSDTMMVASLFFALDNRLNADIQTALDVLNPMLQAATNDDGFSLEKTVYMLSRLIYGQDAIEVKDKADRNALYAEIMKLQTSIAKLKENGSSFQILPLSDIANMAEVALAEDDKGLALRYALKELNTFMITGFDYSAHNQVGELALQSEAHPQGMTEMYLHQRIKMWNGLLTKNMQTGSRMTELEFWNGTYYQDLATQQTVGAAHHAEYGSPDAYGENPKVVFGTDHADPEIKGGKKADYLFGGAGHDTLNGEAGHDYLEGGSGQDTYFIQDHDTVFDSDGRGRIVFSGRERLLGSDTADYTAARFARSSSDPDNTWYSIGQDGKRDGELVAERQEEDLLLSRQGGDSATVKGFFASAGSAQPGTFSALGITLADEVPAEGSSEAAFSQSGHVGRYNVFYLGGHHHFQISGAEKDDIVFATGTAGAKINGGSGSDLVFGSFHADTIYGGEGNDILSGSAYVGAGSPRTPEEQALDADTIIGGGGRDLISGMAGDDIIHTGFENEHLLTGSGGERGDWASGGLGNDRVYGSINHDFLSGAEGMDWLYGGAGDDVLIGDAFYRAGRRSQHIYVESTITGPTYLPGGGVIPPSVHRPALGTEFSFRDGAWETTTLNSVTRTHPDTDEWAVAINRETGDYALTAKVLPNNEDHRVAANGATDFLYGGHGDDLLIGQDGGDHLYGGHGDDILWGDDNRDPDVVGHDYLSGGEGNDVLHGGKGNDVLIGGSGSDRLLGGEGADVYLFHSRDLQNAADTNTVSDSDGRGTVVIDGHALHTLSWVADAAQPERWQAKETGWVLSRSGSHLYLSGAGLFQSGIVLENHRAGDFGLHLPDAAAPKDPEQPDSPKSDNGGAATTPDAPKGKYETPERTWSGSEDGDTLTGTDAREDLNGYGGDDTIFGMGGNDVINGGEGNDVLVGGSGADTYVFSGAWGQDTIRAEGAEDHIYFKDTKLAEVGFKREGKDLWIHKHGSSDSILIQNQFADSTSQSAQAVVNWEFADGDSEARASAGLNRQPCRRPDPCHGRLWCRRRRGGGRCGGSAADGFTGGVAAGLRQTSGFVNRRCKDEGLPESVQVALDCSNKQSFNWIQAS